MTISLEAVREATREERDRALGILEACDQAGRSAMASGFIAGDMTASAVRRHLESLPPKPAAKPSASNWRFDPATIERELAAARTLQ